MVVKTCYAAHRLRLGRYILRYPLVRVSGDRVEAIQHLSQEVESTIFVDGEILLIHPDFREDSQDLIDIEASSLWQILFPYIDEVKVVLPRLPQEYIRNKT